MLGSTRNDEGPVREPGPGVDGTQLLALEGAIGCQLPAQMRSYYSRWNGGLPYPLDVPEFSSLCVRLHWRSGAKAARSGRIASIGDMLEIDSNPAMDLLQTWTLFKGRFPDGLLCFLSDPGGNLFLIGTGSHNLGKIFFWARGYEADEDEGEVPSYDNIADVAPTFIDFLLALRGEPGPDESHEDWIRRNYPE